jgi:hypothetical protein
LAVVAGDKLLAKKNYARLNPGANAPGFFASYGVDAKSVPDAMIYLCCETARARPRPIWSAKRVGHTPGKKSADISRLITGSLRVGNGSSSFQNSSSTASQISSF